ncbi:histidine phosphatase family protein [Ureibacillus sinduriensis]|uniref:Fructose-2,6-bisphosphatase n=1 Tax=Ureibacillus sinduriensis BLB-1 = JCM 15800 TaxID=1384057 RepID=A0A0A3HPR2_9BACL|nr:histidine phosphatase family protein [Ureibacillus sinduriensis]KGR74566.1 fructose-2,6-bisphosphatase [Ureibacillus sinduriensis BLB-1 = JCM 15800]
MGNPVIVHLIRHEKTDANKKGKYIGWTDEPIRVKESTFHVPINPALVYGSDLRRCIETAQLYFPKADYLSDRNLRELNFGDFEMKTYKELESSTIYRRWIDDPQFNTPPNGESYTDFVERVHQSMRKILTKSGEYTFVVHGGVIRVLLFLFGPMEIPFQQITVSHRTIYSMHWTDFSEVREGKRCKSLSEEPIMAKESL